jgi:ABC-type transporter permease protein
MKSISLSKLHILVGREYMVRVHKKSFIVTTLLIPLLIAAVLSITIYVSMNSLSKERIAVIDETGLYSNVLTNDEFYTFISSTEPLEAYMGKEKLEGNDLTAVLYIHDTLLNNPNGWSLYSYKKLPEGVVSYINNAFTNHLREQRIAEYNIEGLPEIIKNVETTISVPTYQWDDQGKSIKSSGTLAGGIGMVLSIIILGFMSNYAGQVMSGVLEEKKNRIMEVIVSTVRPIEMMISKIVGVFLVGLTQVAIWLIFAGIIFVVASLVAVGGVYDLSSLSQLDPTQVGGLAGSMSIDSISDMQSSLEIVQSINFVQLGIMLLAYFIGGYLLYASLFAAIGSSVSSDEDAGQFVMPFILIMTLGFYIAIGSMDNPDGSMAFWGSMIPLSSPFVMMMRLPYGVPVWEQILSIGLLFLTAFGIAWLAARIYRVGILFTGKKPSLKDLWSWLYL